MGDHRVSIREWAQQTSGFWRLKAYTVSPDGFRQPIDGAAIVVELDEDRGSMLARFERTALIAMQSGAVRCGHSCVSLA